MRSFRNKLVIVSLILMTCSTLANILFYVDMISKDFVQIGFILVMICSIVINLSSLGRFKKSSDKIIPEESSILTKIVAIIVLLCWIISYGMAIFLI